MIGLGSNRQIIGQIDHIKLVTAEAEKKKIHMFI